MADTKQYLDFIIGKKQRREKVEGIDFSKMPAGVDVMAVAEELGRGLPNEYQNEIYIRAGNRGKIKSLDYSVIDIAVPSVEHAAGVMPRPAPLPAPPKRPAPSGPPGPYFELPTPTKEEMPRPLKESVPARAKEFGAGVAGVTAGGIEGFGNIAGALGAAGFEADTKTTADFINAFTERHLRNPERDVLSDIIQGLGSTLPFLAGGRLVAGGVRLAGMLAKTQKGLDFANKLGSLLGISSIATANALVEGGAAAQELRYEGAGREKQQETFWKAFTANIPVSLALNRWMLGGKGGRLAAGWTGAKSEFAEETLQSVISKLAQGKEVDMGQALYEGGIGAIVGGGMGAAFPGGHGPTEVEAEQPMPGLPLTPNLDEATKARAMDMAQRDPIAAMKSVVPASEWPAIDRMAAEIAESAEAEQTIPATEKRAAAQMALTEILTNSLTPALPAVPGAVVEGVQPGTFPAPEIDPQVTFMRAQMAVLKKVAEKAQLQGGQIAGLIADRVHGGEVRTLVERGLAENKTPDQIAEEFLKTFEGAQVEGVAPAAPAGPEAARKQPWEMTAKELSEKINPSDLKTLQEARPLLKAVFPEFTAEYDPWNIYSAQTRNELPRVPMTDFTKRHREIIKQALAAGKPVPPAVLRDYPEAAPEAPGRWTDIVPAAQAAPRQAVAAIDMTEEGAGAVIIKTDNNRFLVRSESVDVAGQDPDGFFDSLEEAKMAVEAALPAEGALPAHLPIETALPAIQAVPVALGERPGIPEAALEYEAQREQARIEGEPVYEGDTVSEEDFAVPEAGHPGASTYTEARKRFKALTPDQHKALVRGLAASGQEVPGEVMAEYPELGAQLQEEALREQRELAEAPAETPLLGLIRSMGYINKANYEKHWGGELQTDDMRFYIRKNGRATISTIAEAAAEAGILPEYSETALFEAIGEELRGRAAVAREEGAGFLAQPEPFYSKLQRTIEQKMTGPMPAVQLQGMIKAAGIKQDELDWFDLDGFLKDNPKPTKQQVLEYLAANRLEIKEITKGKEGLPSFEDIRYHSEDGEPFQGYFLKTGNAKVWIEKDGKKITKKYDNTGSGFDDLQKEYLKTSSQKDLTKFSQYQLPGGTNYREVFLTAPLSMGAWKDGHPEYNDVENPIVRLRLNDRVVDGKKTLFIEEIQPPKTTEMYPGGPEEEGDVYYGKDRPGMPKMYQGSKGIDLGIKYLIRYASENGYDAVAWTTGEQQAERYDLSKHFKEIAYVKVDDHYDLEGILIDGSKYSIGSKTEKELPEFVGKEVASKIVSGEGRYSDARMVGGGKGANILEGLDLKVGGEDLKKIYDQSIPSFVNKFTKKWGGRVEDIKLSVEAHETNETFYGPSDATIHSLAITPDLRRAAMTEGFPLFEPGHVYTQAELFPTELEAFTIPPAEAVEKVIDDIKNVKPVGQFHDLRLKKAAKQIEADLKKDGLTKFIGMKVETIQDAAEIVATVRHPLIEHSWLIYVKNGRFVGSRHYTTGNLARIKISSLEISEQVKKDMVAMGADGFYNTHNHPSGNPTPSGEDYDIGQARYLAREHGDAFKGSLVTDHKYYSVIGADGKATFNEFKTEQPAFRKRDLKKVGEGDKARIEQAEGPDVIMSPALAAKFSKDILQGKALALMFLDNKSALMSFDHIDPKSDINAYVSKHAKGYGSNQVVLVTGEEGMAKMKQSGVLKGIYADLIVLSNDGSYKSARLGQVRGWSREEFKPEEIGQFADSETAGMIAEPGAMYRPEDYRAIVKKAKPGAKLTARGRIGNIPRGATVTLVDVDPTGQAIVDYEGQVVLARLDMFKETYQKPVGEIPGIPVKRAIERATGVKPVEHPVVTTQMRILKDKLATEAKAANTAGKAVKAKLLEDLRTKRKSAESIRKAAIEYIGMVVPKADQWKFIKMALDISPEAEAKGTVTLAKAVVRADAEADKVYRRGLVEDIKKVSSRALESLRVDVEYKEAMRSLLAEFDLVKHRPETILKLKALQDYVTRAEAAGKDVFLPDEMTKRLRILATRSVDEISNGELETGLRDLYILEAVGREGQARKEMAWEIEKNMWLRDFVADAKPIGGLAQELSEASKQWAWAQENYWALSPMNVLADRLDGGTGKHNGAHSRMKQIMDGDFFRFLNLRREHLDPCMALMEKHGLEEKNLDRIAIYAYRVQKDGVARVLASMPELAEEYVRNLTLTPQEMEVYSIIRLSYGSLHPEVKRLMRKLYNREVGTLDNYVSMRMDWDKLTDMEVLERLAVSPEEFTGMRKNITAGFTKTRKPGAKAPIIMNIGKVFIQSITDMTYFIAMQENVKKFSEITNPKTNPEYMEAVGPIGTKIIRSWLDLLARQGKAEGSKSIPSLDAIRVNVGSAILGFKLSSFLIQTTSFMDGCAAVGGQNMTVALAKFLSDGNARAWLVSNFSKYRERVGDDMAFNALSKKEWLRTWQRMGYLPLKWLDGIMAGTTTLAAYNRAAKELGVAPGGSGPLNAEAAKSANFWLDRTQASPFFIDVGVAFNSPKFLIGNVSVNKALLQFKQFVINRWFFMSYDIPRMESTTDKASAYAYLLAAGAAEMGIRGASRGIILTAMASVGLGIASAIRGAKDDDDMWQDYFMNLVGMCPFADTPISAMKYGSIPVPSVDVFAKMLLGGKDALNAQNGYRKVTGLRKALIGMASLFGIPFTSQAGQIWSWAYNPKTLTFPYNVEYRELTDLAHRRTAGETARLRRLDSSKGRFTAYARAYRDAMARGDIDAATKAVSGATAALGGL